MKGIHSVKGILEQGTPIVKTPTEGRLILVPSSFERDGKLSVDPRRVRCPAETSYLDLEKLALGLLISSRKLRPYFQAHVISVYTSYPLRQILHRPKTSERLMQWSIELSQFKIRYMPRTAIKRQAVAHFIAELTPGERTDDQANSSTLPGAPQEVPREVPAWDLYVDGSSNDKGSEASLILSLPGPERVRIEYALRLEFKASNNEAEYEAFLAGLRLA